MLEFWYRSTAFKDAKNASTFIFFKGTCSPYNRLEYFLLYMPAEMLCIQDGVHFI